MAGQVTFTVNADVAKAISGILSITGAQGKVVEGFKHVKEHGNFATEKLQEFGHELLAIGTAYLSLEGVKKVFEGIAEAIQKGREEMIKLNAASRGGASLPQNIGDLPGFKKKTLALSNEFGLDAKTVIAPLLKQVGEDAGNLPVEAQDEMTRQSLRTFHASGVDPRTIFQTMLSQQQVYGDDPKQAANRMMWLKSHGVGIERQGELMPAVMPAAKFSGISENELDALTAAAVKTGASKEKAIAGVRRLLLGMEDSGEEQGLHGSMVEKLQQVAALKESDPKAFQKFAGKRTEDVVSGIAGSSELVSGYLKELGGIGRGDQVEGVLGELERDHETAMAMRGERLEQVNANLPAQASMGQQRFAERAALRGTGARILTQQKLGQWATGWGIDAAVRWAGAAGSAGGNDPLVVEALKAQSGGIDGPVTKAGNIHGLWSEVDKLTDDPRIRTPAVGRNVMEHTARALEAGKHGDTVSEAVELIEAIKVLKEAGEALKEAAGDQAAAANVRSRNGTSE